MISRLWILLKRVFPLKFIFSDITHPSVLQPCSLQSLQIIPGGLFVLLFNVIMLCKGYKQNLWFHCKHHK